jgi:hypothetical protein
LCCTPDALAAGGPAANRYSTAEYKRKRLACLKRAVVQLLEAGDGKAVSAAVAAGRELDPQDRWAVLQALEACRARAGEYPAAGGHVSQLAAAWAAKHGSEQPPPRRA